MSENKNINTEVLTDENIDTIVNTAKAAVPEGTVDIRDIKESVQIDPDADLVVGEAIENDNGVILGVSVEDNNDDEMDEIDRIAESFDKHTANVSLFDIEEGASPVDEESVMAKAADSVKGIFDLSDEEVFQMIEVIKNMRNDEKYPVYANLPAKVQQIIAKLAYDNKMPISMLNNISKEVLNEFMNEAGVDSALIDLEKALDEALKIPSLMDMYSEHTKNVMDTVIPETIDRIKDQEPEKAEKLQGVVTAFRKSYTFSMAKEAYLNNTRIRKAVRRHEMEFKRSMDKFNFMNEKTKFKMNDVTNVPKVLCKIFIEDLTIDINMYEEDETLPEILQKLISLNTTTDDIQKFCVLICKSCENKNPDDVIDASYMYYMVRNIIALRHTHEAKTDFAVELINNICDTITFIRDKESEFNESNLDKSKRSKKSNKK